MFAAPLEDQVDRLRRQCPSVHVAPLIDAREHRPVLDFRVGQPTLQRGHWPADQQHMFVIAASSSWCGRGESTSRAGQGSSRRRDLARTGSWRPPEAKAARTADDCGSGASQRPASPCRKHLPREASDTRTGGGWCSPICTWGRSGAAGSMILERVPRPTEHVRAHRGRPAREA